MENGLVKNVGRTKMMRLFVFVIKNENHLWILPRIMGRRA